MDTSINKVRIMQKGIKSSRSDDEYRSSEEYSVAVYRKHFFLFLTK